MSTAETDYERLIRPIEHKMIRSVWRILRNPDDADDALQDALEAIWKRLDRIDRHPNPHALILRICANTAYDTLRRRLRRSRHENNSPPPGHLEQPTPSAPDRLASYEAQEQIFRAVGQLPRNQATAFLMRALHEQSYQEIAQALGCSEVTARTHVTRARTRLRKLLARLAPLQSRRSS